MRRLLVVICMFVGHDRVPSGRWFRSSKNWGPALWAPILVEPFDCRRCGERNVWETWEWEAEPARSLLTFAGPGALAYLDRADP